MDVAVIPVEQDEEVIRVPDDHAHAIVLATDSGDDRTVAPDWYWANGWAPHDDDRADDWLPSTADERKNDIIGYSALAAPFIVIVVGLFLATR